MQDIFCAYYTESEEITNYMVRKLELFSGDTILEPSAGEGVFIDAVLNQNKNVSIEALEINPDATAFLKSKYKNSQNVKIRLTDTLLDEQLDLIAENSIFSTTASYDKVIGNPPYGAWQDYDKRSLLKKKYLGHYVKETYTLFLLRCLSVLKDKGRLSFIIPDTFLFLNMHSRLREIILKTSKIEEIVIFPSKFFPGVSFGYSNLSIITLQRTSTNEALTNSVRIIKGLTDPRDLTRILDNNTDNLQVHYLRQMEILEAPQHRFIITAEKTSFILVNSKATLGEIADIVTGFYTGDNRTFIRAAEIEVKGSKNYQLVDYQKVHLNQSVYGITGIDEGYIPFIKGPSSRSFNRPRIEWFVRWDAQTVSFYKKDKKARFQNSEYYFKIGIGIPMVKSSKIKATLLDACLFDQSIVGIFPKDAARNQYILALMNSTVVNELIHAINPTANNSANYIKQIPYIEPDVETMNEITTKVNQIISYEKSGEFEKSDQLQIQLDEIITGIYSEFSSHI